MARTNIDIDDRLMAEGMKRLKCHTKRELIHLALQQLLRLERQKDILALAGKVRWKGDLRHWRDDAA